MALPTAAEPVPFKLDEHGVARVGGTRVTLEVILGGFKRGETAEDLHDGFPSVALADIYGTISYYLHHRDEVEEYLAEAERDGERIAAKYADPERERAFANDLRRRWAERHGPTPG
jgi:uncharacterized protein (DUF433 family)